MKTPTPMRPISTPYGTDQRPAELEADLPQPPMTAELPAEPVIPIYELPTHYDMYEKYYSPSITSSRTRASSLYSSNHIGRSGTGNYRHIVATSKLLPPPPLREAPSPPRSYGGSIGGSGNCHRWTERPAIDEDEASERASLMSRASRERRVQRFGIGGAGNSVRRNAIMRRARSTSSCSSTNVPSEDGSIIHNHGMGTDSERTSQYSKESLDSGADKLLGRLMRPIRRRKVEIIEEDVNVYWDESRSEPPAPPPPPPPREKSPIQIPYKPAAKPNSKTARRIERWFLEPFMM